MRERWGNMGKEGICRGWRRKKKKGGWLERGGSRAAADPKPEQGTAAREGGKVLEGERG